MIRRTCLVALIILGGALSQAAAQVAAPQSDRIVDTLNTYGRSWTPDKTVGLTTTVVTLGTVAAHSLGGLNCYNPNAVVAYVQFFDTSGAVTLGTTSPTFFMPIPATVAGWMEWTNGVRFANAIKVAATTTATGSTANATALDCSWIYK